MSELKIGTIQYLNDLRAKSDEELDFPKKWLDYVQPFDASKLGADKEGKFRVDDEQVSVWNYLMGGNVNIAQDVTERNSIKNTPEYMQETGTGWSLPQMPQGFVKIVLDYIKKNDSQWITQAE